MSFATAILSATRSDRRPRQTLPAVAPVKKEPEMIGKFTFQAPANILFEPGASGKLDELIRVSAAQNLFVGLEQL